MRNGEKMNLVLYIHGKGGSPAESEHYKSLFPEYHVIGLDYQTFTPWATGKEIHTAVSKFKNEYEKIILIANSIGAFFSMNADISQWIDSQYDVMGKCHGRRTENQRHYTDSIWRGLVMGISLLCQGTPCSMESAYKYPLRRKRQSHIL